MKFNIKYKYKGKVLKFKCVELLYFKGYIDIVGLNGDDNKPYIIETPYTLLTTYKLRKLPWKRISTKKSIRYFFSKVKTGNVIPVERDEMKIQFNISYATELKKVIDILDKDLRED